MSVAAKKPSDVRRDLEKDLAAATVLKEHLRQMLGDALDSDTLKDTIEGETSLLETINAVAFEIGVCMAQAKGIGELKKSLDGRKSRIEAREELLRTMLANVLDMLGERQLKVAAATITHKDVPPKLNVVEEAEVPSQFWKPQDPALDRAALTDALKARSSALDAVERLRRENGFQPDAQSVRDALARVDQEYPPIPGAELGNGSMTVQLRFS